MIEYGYKKFIKEYGLRKISFIAAAVLTFTALDGLASSFSSGEALPEEETGNDVQLLDGNFIGIDEESASQISDGEYITVYKSDKINLTVSAEEKIAAVYIVWNTPPEEYIVNNNNITDGFLHKLIEFDDPIDAFTLRCENKTELCDIYLYASKVYPEETERWSDPCERADMLVLSTHADDEYLMFGGTIPYYAKEKGLQVQVVYLTTHWLEQPRPHELLNGLWKAGVKNYPVFGVISDIPLKPIWTLQEAAELYDFNEVLDWFTEQIRRFRPSVIVTHDKNGEYGHGAHKLAAKTVMDAVEISADADRFPLSAEKYGVWDVPKTYLHFWSENTITMDWEQPLESFGGITAREAASLAYGCHKSQHIWGYAVGYQENWDCRQFGLYRSLVGADEKADFMDHIIPVDITEETSASEPVTEAETSPAETSFAKTQSERTEISDTISSGQDSSNGYKSENDPSVYLIAAGVAIFAVIIIILLINIIRRRK